MRVESNAERGRRLLKPAAIVVMLLVALVVPIASWYAIGRRPPLAVVLQADRHVVAAGAELVITARPRRTAPGEVKLTWSGPGIAAGAGGGPRLRWRAPRKAGTATVAVEARLAGSVARDRLSFAVLPRPPQSYPISRPPAPPRRPRVPACVPGAATPEIVVHGEPRPGANIVVETRSAGGGKARPWVWWRGAAETARRGTMVNLRVPETRDRDATEIVVELVRRTPGTPPCRSRHLHRVALLAKPGGPRADRRFADFDWLLIGPGAFRFNARPPRDERLDPLPASYSWDFGDSAPTVSRKPQVAHRFRRARPVRLVRLEVVVAGRLRYRAVKAIRDRTAE